MFSTFFVELVVLLHLWVRKTKEMKNEKVCYPIYFCKQSFVFQSHPKILCSSFQSQYLLNDSSSTNDLLRLPKKTIGVANTLRQVCKHQSTHAKNRQPNKLDFGRSFTRLNERKFEIVTLYRLRIRSNKIVRRNKLTMRVCNNHKKF